MKSSRNGFSSVAKNTSMEHGSDVLAKNGSLLPEKRTMSWAEVAQRGIKQLREIKISDTRNATRTGRCQDRH